MRKTRWSIVVAIAFTSIFTPILFWQSAAAKTKDCYPITKAFVLYDSSGLDLTGEFKVVSSDGSRVLLYPFRVAVQNVFVEVDSDLPVCITRDLNPSVSIFVPTKKLKEIWDRILTRAEGEYTEFLAKQTGVVIPEYVGERK